MFQLKQFWNRARRGVFFVLLLLLFILKYANPIPKGDQ